MKKKLSYRDKLIELAYIYDVKEIKDYEKSRKNLTSGQLELILKKNKIVIPKDFNCKDFFPSPEPLIPKNISRVMSLRDGTKKMSKSEESDYSRINLKDTADDIIKKVKKAKSDSETIPGEIKSLENKPEALNLLTIYSELTKKSLEKIISEMAGKEYSFLKTKLAEALINEITPVGKEIQKLLKDKSHLKNILKKGTEKANIIAEENLKNIREKVGLI